MSVQSAEINPRLEKPETPGIASRLAGECWNWAEDKAERSLTVAKVTGEGLALGMADGAKDAWAHKKETGVKLAWSAGAGLVMSSAEHANPIFNFGTALAGVGLGGAFVLDTMQHGKIAAAAMSDAWKHGENASNLDAMKKALGIYAFDTALMTAGSLATAAARKLPAEAYLRFGVEDRLTADPARSLIRIGGYGTSRWSAAAMEKVIASGRNGVLTGELPTAEDLERFIAGKYVTSAHGILSREHSREYLTAGMLPKHEAYRDKMIAMVGPQTEHTATATIGGLEFKFVTTRKVHAERVEGEEAWTLPGDATTFRAAKARTGELFTDLRQNIPNLGNPGYIKKSLDLVAEMEWLNAQTWKYPRGSAGVSQLQARTWLELAGIDSGRYKSGIDPNMEALTRSLDDFKAAYPSFFERAPRLFSGSKLRRTLPGSNMETLPEQPKIGNAVVTAS